MGEQQCFFTLALVRSPAGGSVLLLRVERNMWFRWLAGGGVSEFNGLSSRGLNLALMLVMTVGLLFN